MWLEVGGGPRLELGVASLVKVVRDGRRGDGRGGVALFHRNIPRLLTSLGHFSILLLAVNKVNLMLIQGAAAE